MLGLMGAMQEEVAHLRALLAGVTTHKVGGRDYHVGTLDGHAVVLAFSRWGKVASASTATTMVDRFGARELVFTGVAGGIDPALKVGDVVVADTLYQHDLDASPLFAPMEVPLLGATSLPVELERVQRAARAGRVFLDRLVEHVEPAELTALGVGSPGVYVGPIASGDQFIASTLARERVASLVPGVLCVEMEGAAVAQVAYEHGVPLTVVRVISDGAAEGSAMDFQRFITEVASRFTAGIVRAWLEQ
ncbi:MAG: 5'-methylthioadenosine/adenosylhomocysteine nucleosidase [Phycisphaerales bacterium JB063]